MNAGMCRAGMNAGICRDECRDMQGRVEAGMCRAGMRQGCAGQG